MEKDLDLSVSNYSTVRGLDYSVVKIGRAHV